MLKTFSPIARAGALAAWALSFVLLFSPACRTTPRNETVQSGPIAWHEWSSTAFDTARAEHRLVLLHLGAVWCHWCHVMEETTYADGEVRSLIRASYVPIYVDSDARPDLANRYEEYGWPATILFDAEGRELAKFRGYIEPRRMAELLAGFRDDPTPGPSAQLAAAQSSSEMTNASGVGLEAELRDRLIERWRAGYDRAQGGWGDVLKYLDADSVEYALRRAASGDEDARAMARTTLDQCLRLLDPAWGGLYQYSHGGTWEHPHYEKIMPMQAAGLSIYSQAYAQWSKPEYLEAARAIAGYLQRFLRSPDGAFYTSQDADLVQGEHAEHYFALDDAGRRALGMPRIDTHIYARENGWAIDALCAFHAASSDERALDAARAASQWVLEHRALAGGGFAHGDSDVAGPFLGDTLAMGRAFLSLYEVTADRTWLARSSDAARFIAQNFRTSRTDEFMPGFVTAKPAAGANAGPLAPGRQADENIALARWLNRLSYYTGDPSQRELARSALQYLATPEVVDARRIMTAGILLADRELSSEPAHVTVVGKKREPRAAKLFHAALACADPYKRVEWLDADEGPLPNPDLDYPAFDDPAAFACSHGACSLPISDPQKLRAALERSRP